MRADAVFEGGGVKGIALAGALRVAEEQYGYQWVNVAGTSVGAIAAALVAVGYTAREIEALLRGLDFAALLDRGWLDRIPLAGPLLSLGLELGLYEGDALEAWIRDKLSARGVRTFGDLLLPEFADDPRYRFRLRVIATDLSLGKLLILPQDAAGYGLNPDALDVARAVRMSCGIPFFFKPVIWPYRHRDGSRGKSVIVDGGVLSNFPVWLFDCQGVPPWPTFGFRLVEPGAGQPRPVCGPISMLEALIATMLEAHDARHVEEEHWVRTLPIPTLGVRTTDFRLSDAMKERLVQSGVRAAEKFFAGWDWEAYQREYRT